MIEIIGAVSSVIKNLRNQSLSFIVILSWRNGTSLSWSTSIFLLSFPISHGASEKVHQNSQRIFLLLDEVKKVSRPSCGETFLPTAVLCARVRELASSYIRSPIDSIQQGIKRDREREREREGGRERERTKSERVEAEENILRPTKRNFPKIGQRTTEK